MTDLKEQQQLVRAYDLGAQAGIDAASWIFDGNTTLETYQAVLLRHQDGDPRLEEMVMEPSWLGGIWAGDPTPRSLAVDLGIDPDVDVWLMDQASTAYENGATDKFWSEIEAHARRMVEDWT